MKNKDCFSFPSFCLLLFEVNIHFFRLIKLEQDMDQLEVVLKGTVQRDGSGQN
jgi:hypothetical protein